MPRVALQEDHGSIASMAARRYFLFLAFAALICTATLVRCQEEAEAADSEAEIYEEVVADTPAAEPVKKAAAAAGLPIDQYKALAEEYLAKATEVGKEYAAQAQEIASKYIGEGMKVLESTLDKLGVKKSAGKTEL